MDIFKYESSNEGLSNAEIRAAVLKSLEAYSPRKALIIPPDQTRAHSGAGEISNIYYHALSELGCRTDILPALGTHRPMTSQECRKMFGDIPYERFIAHDWRRDLVTLGKITAEEMHHISGGLWSESADVQINRLVMDKSYDLIISVGQVVPHEVIGMSNHAKNLFVGVGGADMINKSHMLGAICGMENCMGRDHSPVRRLFDLCMQRYMASRPILFALTVCTAPHGRVRTHGLFIGTGRQCLERAIELSRQKNINFVEKKIKKCLVYLDPNEFKSTWLGNKAIYRSRMALADNAELLILAPGVERFGEDRGIDRIIRKYGYRGREHVLALLSSSKAGELKENLSAAAHLIHGSSDGRFRINYAVKKMPVEDMASVGYDGSDYDLAAARYDPGKLHRGFNILPDGEEIYFIPDPALGLWVNRERFHEI